MAKTKSVTGYIYGLCDEKGSLRYIGQTRDLVKRMDTHCRLSNNLGNTPRQKWIRSILEKGQFVKVILLSQPPVKDLDDEEVRLIALYKSNGFRLLNSSVGGKDIVPANDGLKRVKAVRPWGKTHSPIQAALMKFRMHSRTLRKLGDIERSDYWARFADNMSLGLNGLNKDLVNLTLFERSKNAYEKV